MWNLIYEHSTCGGCNFEPIFETWKYGAGVGLIEESLVAYIWPQVDYHYLLKYYKKGTLECGSPDITDSTVSIHHNKFKNQQNSYIIYPNPAKNNIWIESNKTSTFNATIFNTNGKVVAATKKYSVTQKIDISEIPQGLYFISIQSKEENCYLKLIKE